MLAPATNFIGKGLGRYASASLGVRTLVSLGHRRSTSVSPSGTVQQSHAATATLSSSFAAPNAINASWMRRSVTKTECHNIAAYHP
jgi:hypothetical protein